MEEVACKVEHSLDPEVEESISTLLGHPEICLDGKPIPKGRCCRKNLKTVGNTVVSLAELKPGERGKITYIKPGSHSNLHQLISMGLHPVLQSLYTGQIRCFVSNMKTPNLHWIRRSPKISLRGVCARKITHDVTLSGPVNKLFHVIASNRGVSRPC